MIHTLSEHQLLAYNSLNKSEKIANVINYCFVRHAQMKHKRKCNNIDFSMFLYYKSGYEDGSHDGDCIHSPQTCRSCAYYDCITAYITYYPLFLRLNIRNYKDILSEFVWVYSEVKFDIQSDRTHEYDMLFWDIYYELKNWKLL